MTWEQPGPWHDVGPCEVVYGVNAGQLVLAPMDRALELAALRELLLSAGTWGEFMSSLSPERCEQVREGFDDDLPPSSEPFDQQAVPGVADCDWPDSPSERMTEWIPADIGKRYGRLVNTTFSGVIAEFDTTAAPSVTAELESRGFRCVRNDALVGAMYGNFPFSIDLRLSPAPVREVDALLESWTRTTGRSYKDGSVRSADGIPIVSLHLSDYGGGSGTIWLDLHALDRVGLSDTADSIYQTAVEIFGHRPKGRGGFWLSCDLVAANWDRFVTSVLEPYEVAGRHAAAEWAKHLDDVSKPMPGRW